MRRDPFTLRQANHVFYEEREREAGAAGSDASAVGACASALSPTYLLPLSCTPSAAHGANGLNSSGFNACNSSAHNADAPQLGAEWQDGMRMRDADAEADASAGEVAGAATVALAASGAGAVWVTRALVIGNMVAPGPEAPGACGAPRSARQVCKAVCSAWASNSRTRARGA